jgi:hypothetical protein
MNQQQFGVAQIFHRNIPTWKECSSTAFFKIGQGKATLQRYLFCSCSFQVKQQTSPPAKALRAAPHHAHRSKQERRPNTIGKVRRKVCSSTLCQSFVLIQAAQLHHHLSIHPAAVVLAIITTIFPPSLNLTPSHQTLRSHRPHLPTPISSPPAPIEQRWPGPSSGRVPTKTLSSSRTAGPSNR